MADIEKYRRFFAADTYAALSSCRLVSAENGEPVCEMDVTENHRNAAGGVHGAAIFTLIDFAFAVCVNIPFADGETDKATLAESVSVSYMRRPRGNRLTAKAVPLHLGRTVAVSRIIVYDEDGRPVAEALCNGIRT
ncbi:MAG: PaaI family thioesterase [Oscillospiraceae bacterium]|jgi:acyl-CoA thioesterase|nr:PaaI family thioesterase [Oscillospiraceae bacterium]